MDARLDPGIGSGQLFPRIETARLRLRAFRLADAAELQRLAGDRQVAEGTLLPHPYEGGTARAWIWEQALAYAAGNGIDFAIERAEDTALVGAIGLEIDRVGACSKLGYWLGRPYWGRGYATEAVSAVIGYGFAVLELERVCAPRFRWNAASARVLEKAGLAQEGSRREYVAARGREETIETHGILRWEWAARPTQAIAPAAPYPVAAA
ncbi:MAG: GNAT family N-acetyltransferase [Burkholderiales bacterium]|jgi:ribosomal-protein-alanine N-acetyltransferase